VPFYAGQGDILSCIIFRECSKMDVVECHSGFSYAEKPVALTWNDQRLEVDGILATWRTPAGCHFRVRTRNLGLFELVYFIVEDQWQIKPL
jgi:hypothetical protein